MAKRPKTQEPEATLKAPIAVGLVRCSTDMQEHSIEDQESEIRAWAEESGHRLVEMFRDEGVSGSELDRPGMSSLMTFLEASPVAGTLVAWKRNRMARPGDPREGLALELRIEQLGWKIHYLQDSSPTGNALLDTIMGAVGYYQAGEYLRSLSSDTLRGQIRNLLRGGMTSGKIPYGYAKVIVDADDRELRRIERRTPHRKMKGELAKWVPGDPAEVEVVGWLFTEYAAGKLGFADLAADLNARGISGPEGGDWKSGTIRDILTNPVYTGDMVWNRETTSKFFKVVDGKLVAKGKARRSTRPGKRASKTTSYAANDPKNWIVVPDQHQALVDRETWQRAQAVRQARAGAQGHKRWARHGYPLTGIVYCGNCGGRMVGHSPSVKGYRYRRYTCASYHQNRTCRPFWVSADKLESAVPDLMREAYQDAVMGARRGDLRRHLVAILEEYFGTAQPGVDLPSLERERGRLEKQVSTAIERMGDIDLPAVARKIAEQIDAWSRRVGEIDQLLAEARARGEGEQDRVQAAADRIMRMLQGLAERIEEAPKPEQKAFYAEALERIELKFTVDEPEQTGLKRARLRFVGGHVQANALLADTSRALATSVSSSGRTRTYNQVVNSHLLYH